MSQVKQILSNVLVDKGFELTAAIVLVLLAAQIARVLILRRVDEPQERRRIRRIVFLITLFAIIICSAFILSGSLGSLGISLGVATAGVALALQTPITNVAARLSNLTGSYYKVGDRIQIGDVAGDVIGINMMVTTLMEIGSWVRADQYSGRIVRVPNSTIFSSPVHNYSAHFSIVWDEISIPIKYGCNRQLAVELLTRVGTELTHESVQHARSEWKRITERFAVEEARVEPLVTLVANDNWLEYNLRYVTLFNQRRTMKSALFNRIMDEIDEVPDQLAIASSTYDIVAFPPIKVRNEST